MVGVARFELATPASRRRCSTRLSYTPNRGAAYSQLFCTAQRGNHRESAVCAAGPAHACGNGRTGRESAARAAANCIGPLHPSRRLCIYRAPSSLTGPVGASPSGKASVFGTDIPRFESWRPSHFSSPVKWFRMFVGRSAGPARSRNRDRPSVFAAAEYTGVSPRDCPFIPEISRFDPFRCATAARSEYQFYGNNSAGVVAIRESRRFERSSGRIPATKMY